MTDDDARQVFNAEAFNAEQRAAAEEVLAPADGFPCWGCGRLTPLSELEQHGYQCAECHHGLHLSR